MKKHIDAVVFFVFAAFVVCVVLVVATRAVSVSPPAIVHGGPLVVTEVTMDEHEAFCRYTVSQQDGDEKHKTKFAYVQRCGMYHVGETLMLVKGRK